MTTNFFSSMSFIAVFVSWINIPDPPDCLMKRTQALNIRFVLFGKVADLVPHNFWKLNPGISGPHYFWKLDPGRQVKIKSFRGSPL
jgi:hypothetical protein